MYSVPGVTTWPARWLCAALLVGLMMPTIAFSEDRVVMKNGDVITGKIARIADGKVWIQPSYADEFGVAIGEVAELNSGLTYSVELPEYQKVEGQLQVNAAGQQVLVQDGVEQPIALTDVVAAAEPAPYYKRTSHAEVALTVNSGNTDSEATLIYADTRLKVGDHRHYADISFRRDETDGVKTKEQDLFNYNYNWLFNEPWFVGASFTFERDPIKDLDHRYTVGVLFGRDILDDANRFLSVNVGGGYSDEKLGGVSDSGAVGLWKLFYTQNLIDGKMSLFHDHNITYQFYGENNAIFKSNTGLRFDILADIYLTTSLRYDYETEPAPGSSKDDLTFVVGLGAAF